ncbi:MAG TPA: hypothetical protein PKB09_02650 [Candidatus Saccharibacteria bacterium]|nr:hypothetical protein [Candidatus Saccharibacteria bacterium]
MTYKKIPEVRINFSWLLYDVSLKLGEYHKKETAPPEDCEKWAAAYRKEWKKHSAKILTSLCDVMEMGFYRPVIDVSLAPWFVPQSDPLILHFKATPDEFVDVLTHELIHVLLTDSTLYSSKSNPEDRMLLPFWQQLYGKEHDFNTLVHIPVHAIHQYVMVDVLKEPSRLERERSFTKKNNNQAYVRAWEYVDEHGYKEIIEELKQAYRLTF